MTAIQIESKLTFEDFVNRLPDQEGCYEFVNGEIVRKTPTRRHDDIADFIIRRFDREGETRGLNFRVSGRIMMRTETDQGKEQGRNPDVTVVDKTTWETYPSAYSVLLEPPQLVVEVVSTNWEDDYVDKLAEYQRFGIQEYWIIDYLAVGSRLYLGNPKEATIFVCILGENRLYQMNAYRGNDRIISATFPELELSVEQVFNI